MTMPPLTPPPTTTPTSYIGGKPNTFAALGAGAACTILIYLLGVFVPQHPIPAEVQGAIQTLLTMVAVLMVPSKGN